MNIKKIISALGLASILTASTISLSYADTVSTGFENPPYVLGNINAQDGWIKTGTYDVEVESNTYGFIPFGDQTLRLSNAITSGSFGDQTFAKPLTDSVGESLSTNGVFSPGTKQTLFEMEFDFASSTPSAEQPGLFLSVSPDRGDGSRMSYIGFDDTPAGIDVIFFDVQGETNPANFVSTNLGTFSRATAHNIRMTLEVKEGPSNDVVNVWIDGNLEHTGTSWENYYRFDSEASAEQSVRIVKTAIFRAGGTAAPATSGNGFLIDNLSLTSSIPVMPSVPTITSPAHNAVIATSALTSVDWTDSTGTFNPFEYEYEAFSDSGYTSNIYNSGWLNNSQIATAGTPVGTYFLRVRARDTEGNLSDWSNDSELPHQITVVADPTPTPDPFAVPLACTGFTYGAPIMGTNSNNVINGTSGNDLIFALGGADIVNGGGGNDCIVGGPGADNLRGGNGMDILLGEEGPDLLDGGNQDDTLYGGLGSDNLNGGNQSDTLNGEEGNDALNGGNQNDVLNGGDGNDSLRGDNGNDMLDGGANNDSAHGGTGNSDTCTAESENACEL